MGLRTYRAKRNFRRTPEPRGHARRSSRKPSFVIQKHAARRLHYDFRLEMGGVLASWAIPKGPSLDPHDRRLAVHVEDHPLEYGSFEGVIPEGQYGGGTVELWDRGTWEPDGDPERGVREGKLKFRLEGKKLHGRWTLVRMAARDGAKENWLLIKERDETAKPGVDIVEERPASVGTGTGGRVWAKRRRATPTKGNKALPDFEEPQLATLVEEPPEGEGWIHEIKFDGYRLLIRIEGSEIRILTRRGQDWTRRFGPLAAAAAALGVDRALIDGEAVVLKPDGSSDFQALQNALTGERSKEIVFYAFDLLHLDGKDLRRLPLVERKAELKKLLRKAPKSIRFSDHVEGRGDAFFREACRARLEGIVCKRGSAPRSSGRSRDWLKVKCLERQEFVIGGWTDPEGSRGDFGALLLGVREGRKLVYAGRVGTGFTQATLRQLGEKMRPLARESSPFSNPPPARGVHWIEPRLVGEVGFTGWTADRVLRHPAFLGLREDKEPAQVALERKVAVPKLTHPDKVLDPDSGLTKRGLAEYFESVADWILPHVADRPLSLVRCPDGWKAGCFYQKHATGTTPKELGSVKAKEDEEPYVYVKDAKGLAALAQMGVMEIHPWGSRVANVERPDSVTFDIDPSPDVGWEAVKKAAVRVRKFLEDLALESWLKTTGGKGLHVVVPLSGRATWDQARAFSRGVAESLVSLHPDEYLSKASKEARRGKIFIDWLRNAKGATAVGAYSPRARAGAPVSMPIGWNELAGLSGADAYTVANVPERLASGVDPWKEFRKIRQTLSRLHRKR